MAKRKNRVAKKAAEAARGAAAKTAKKAVPEADDAAKQADRQGTLPPGHSYHIPPSKLKAFPGARRVRGKGPRTTWKDSDGNTYEFDRQHGTVEKYDKRGRHQGDYNVETGEQVGKKDSNRKPQGF